MRRGNLPISTIATVLIATSTMVAQQPPPPANAANPAPGCTATPSQLEANKKVAMQFFRLTGDDRVALADPSYKQHNPAFKKRGEDAKISDYEEFKNSFSSARTGRGRGHRGAAAAAG
jgi:aspartate/tyrosine/aromatic aminotransferase